MFLKKVNSLDYDKKDCTLIVCPQCQSSNFGIFKITEKGTHAEHLHVRCIFCDLTYCPELPSQTLQENIR